MRVWVWRSLKGLLCLLLLVLAASAAWSPGASIGADGLGMAVFFLILAALLWMDWKRLEPALPFIGMGAGIVLVLGSPHLAALSAGTTSCKALCGLSLLLSEIGGPLLAALPYALLGLVAIFFGARALFRRR
jgi:hypothetical protein